MALEVDETEELRLFTAGGSVISDGRIEVGNKDYSWTVGAYLTKKHISPDKLKLGIGYLKASKNSPLKQKKGMVLSKVSRFVRIFIVNLGFHSGKR